MVKRKIILCSESLRIVKPIAQQPEQYSYDGKAIIGLLKNEIEALRIGKVDIQPIGFEGKDQFMKELPLVVRNTFEQYRHGNSQIELFIIALRDSDTNDGKKISGFRRKLVDKIKKLISEQEFNRVHIMFAVQAIEAWILADENALNKYLGVTNKVKHINEPEKVENPKQVVQNFFQQFGRKYTPQELLNLLPQLRVSELLRCEHFNKLYTCVKEIVEASA